MPGRVHFSWMTALATLFAFRVFAQAVQWVYPLPVLPGFDAWHGAVLPYPVLLACQLVILVLLVAVLWRLRTTGIAPRRWRFRACFAFGGLYFALMAVRLVGGLTVLSGHPWFAKSLPAFFHLVLAGFILLLGHYLYSRYRRDPDPKAASSIVQAVEDG